MAVDWSMPILVVDDHRTMQAIVARRLRDLGFLSIDTAGDPVTALTMLAQRRYSLILSDWNMEPMSGYQLLTHIRADEKLKPIPFIMVTAESKTENVIIAKQAGVSNYIVKPFNADTLRAKIASVFPAMV